MNHKTFLFVVFAVSLLFVAQLSVFQFVPSVKAQEPQGKSFGNPTLPLIATMNWTRFWNLFNAYSDWALEYNDGSGWKDAKLDLQIIKQYRILISEGINESWVPVDKSQASNCKITLNFTASHTASYRLTFGIDLDVKNYTHREGSWNYSVTYQNYTVDFDWSDVKDIPNLIITHGIRPVGDESWFWFRIRKDSVQQGKNVVIDPNFGYETKATTYSNPTENRIEGGVFTITESGTADSITCALMYITTQSTWSTKCSIYLHSDSCLVGTTEEREITPTTSFEWYTFNFTGTHPSLTANTAYVLVCWSEDLAGVLVLSNNHVTGTEHYQSLVYAANFPNTATFSEVATRAVSIYCTYTIAPSGYALNLRVMDWNLADAITGAIVYKDTDTKTSNGGGWANWTGVSGTVAIKVKYFGFWVNGTFSVTMDADKTINVKCKLYDVTVTAKPKDEIGVISGTNVTAYNNTGTSNGKIKSGITVDTTGQVILTNLPNATLRFIMYSKSDYSIIIANTTQLISSDDYSFNIIANQNYATATLSFSYEAIIWISTLSILTVLPFIVTKFFKKRKKGVTK